MVTIRLARGGSKKRPFYSVLVADQRRSVGGKFIERVGFFNPMARGKEEKLRLDIERIDHWINLGAQPSLRVSQLYKSTKGKPSPAVSVNAEPATVETPEATPSNENGEAKPLN